MATIEQFDPQQIIFKGFDSAGNDVTLPYPLEFELVKSYDSPARSLECVFPLIDAVPELFRLEFLIGKRLLFSGNVDEQISMHNHQGTRLKLSVRSDGAILLDNEARPQIYSHVDLSDMFQKHITPYGFYSLAIGENPFFNKYQILKGTSEWEAFSNFARNALLGTVYVDDDMNFFCGPPHGLSFLLSNRAPEGLKFSSLRVVNNRYAPITTFVVRNQQGVYGTTYNNPESERLGLTRKRYLNPPIELIQTSTAHVIDARIRVHRSMLAKQTVSVVCPGLWDIEFGMKASIEEPFFSCTKWVVEQVRHRLSSNGFGTTFTLLDPKYLS